MEDVHSLDEEQRSETHDDEDGREDFELIVCQDVVVVVVGLIEVDQEPDDSDSGQNYSGTRDQLASNDFALKYFVKLGRLVLDLFALNFSHPSIFQLHLHLLVSVEIHHRRIDQIQRTGRDEDTEETVEPDWTIIIFLKLRNGRFSSFNALHSL